MPQLQLVSDLALFDRRKVLLVRYRRAGYDTGWYLPDVLLKELEHPDDAAKRVMREQLKVNPSKVTLTHVESFEADGSWHLAFHYRAELESGAELDPSDDIAELRWFTTDQLPDRNDVGFNGWALATLGRISGKLRSW